MILGDLVVNGNNYDQWKNIFFDFFMCLFWYVLLYLVLGNYENNSVFYFIYFKLLENGMLGFEEYWWFKDYGNLCIIGFNFNGLFMVDEQLMWLDNVLEQICEVSFIDFVFVQLYYLYKLELWMFGELGFIGEVISRLEQFMINCGKFSIYFFGYIYGYFRG